MQLISPHCKDTAFRYPTPVYLLFALLILTVPLLYSCQRTSTLDATPPAAQLETSANAWLDSKKTAQASERNQRVEQLRQLLDFNGSYTEKAVDGESVIIIPVKAGFVSAYNKDKNAHNYLLLTVAPSGKIRKGNIVQFISDASKIPANTFYTMDTDGRVKFDGSLTFLTIFDRYLFSIAYKNGKQISYTEAKKKKDLTNGNSGVSTNSLQTDTQICTDWYLITTYYYDDGSTEVFEDYLGRTCVDGGCLPNEWCEPQPEDPGGGGGGEPDFEEYDTQAYRLKEWKVYIFPGPTGYAVYSWENIRGKKDSSPAGGYFKSASHHSDECNNPNGVWGSSTVSVSSSTTTVTSTIGGVFAGPSVPSFEISNSASWGFSQIF